MSTRDDALTTATAPRDRVFYAAGTLLDAQDFGDEQLYHRGRLARALLYLHGSGTVAGLLVEHQPEAGARAERIIVRPGLAIDRVGRLVEVPGDECIRVQPWWNAQPDGTLANAFHADAIGPGQGGVIADVFLRYMACERGKTPAFAQGPFDALDAVQPSRLRDAFELQLVARQERSEDLTMPPSPWPVPIDDRDALATALRAAIYGAWKVGEDWSTDGVSEGLVRHEQPENVDATALLLARLTMPATRAPGASRPARADGAVVVNNDLRRFVVSSAALGRMMGL